MFTKVQQSTCLKVYRRIPSLGRLLVVVLLRPRTDRPRLHHGRPSNVNPNNSSPPFNSSSSSNTVGRHNSSRMDLLQLYKMPRKGQEFPCLKRHEHNLHHHLHLRQCNLPHQSRPNLYTVPFMIWINANFRMVACEKKWTGRLGSSKLLEGGNSTASSSSIKTRSGTCSSTLARDAENSRAETGCSAKRPYSSKTPGRKWYIFFRHKILIIGGFPSAPKPQTTTGRKVPPPAPSTRPTRTTANKPAPPPAPPAKQATAAATPQARPNLAANLADMVSS